MKNLILTLLLTLMVVTTITAEEQDTLWFRWTGEIKKVDFTPDDKYVITWTNSIEFWETQQGVVEYFIPTESTGDYNYNEEYLVFAQDSTPKLLNWQSREVIEGFEKELKNIGRIKTAKSKNEFMANTYHEDETFGDQIGNVIYFYDIDKKRKVDSIDLGSSFEKNHYKWKRTIHEYDYVGNNDELIYIIIDDANDILQNIPPMFREKHYYVHFYNRETKELVDSVYSFTNTNEHYGGFNKMQVMNDRSKIAWNQRGGVISFYDVNKYTFFEEFYYDETKVEVNDLDFIKNESIIAIADGLGFKIIDRDTDDLLQQYSFGIEQVKFSNNSNFLATAGKSSIALRNKRWVITDINENEVLFDLNISPNPANNSIRIKFNTTSLEYVELKVIDLVGNEIDVIRNGLISNSYITEYDISNLVNGTYFIRLEIGNDVKTKQFIKE